MNALKTRPDPTILENLTNSTGKPETYLKTDISTNSYPHIQNNEASKQKTKGKISPNLQSTSLQQLISAPPTAKINTEYYFRLTEQILLEFYPKTCKCGNLMTTKIKTRPYSIRCNKCYRQKSRLSYTPLHCMRLPMWMFGWVFLESLERHPNIISAAEISRRLKISNKSALKLKRRFQLFSAQKSEMIKELVNQELLEKFKDFELPHKRSEDITKIIKDKTPVNIDSMVIFSASQRANKGRARFRHGGLTASIYLSDKIGGSQIGSMYQTVTWKKGPVILKSVPTLRQEHVNPVLNDYIPHRIPVFSDEGYKWYYNPNHRAVNHSSKSRGKKYRWAKDRWSKNGVHSQVAEGIQGSFKTAMRNYRYFRPENSTLYAEEWTFCKNFKYFKEKILSKPLKPGTDTFSTVGSLPSQ